MEAEELLITRSNQNFIRKIRIYNFVSLCFFGIYLAILFVLVGINYFLIPLLALGFIGAYSNVILLALPKKYIQKNGRVIRLVVYSLSLVCFGSSLMMFMYGIGLTMENGLA